jgi:Flp pilus assembly pilin Flp
MAVIEPYEVIGVVSRKRKCARRSQASQRGSVFVEYILLVTLVGIGVLVGLATLRTALVNELIDLADAINAIST